ncbi:hypothetical protein [Acidihalobacter prosperus]|uniref:Uncharacterized protein n=1 Tax=Acidihalobacter prosperus TaxID=160660 RepID=A0A1A6C0B5_9GAMM|nr:hypothetical protein [Acidihalobacter prosperus]OBS08002.1 hypothetical protein Thpro_022252 [Acidihalobacter prosperus]
MPIRLPKDAHGYDYEDQICSLLQAHGYYLETRLILKKGSEEVLEFDALATPTNDYQNRKVVEVKSGKWGISDIFKLYGQVLYTSETHAWLIHKKVTNETKKGAIQEVCGSVPVSTININIDGEEKSENIPVGLDIPEKIAKCIFLTSWWSRSADRIAQSKFREWCKSHAEIPEAIRNTQNYLAALDECLFKKSPISRVDALYDAYKVYPQITSSLINYVADTSQDNVKAVRSSVSDKYGRAHLQYVMAQEFRARIAIIKNAYDALLEEADSQSKKGNAFSWGNLIKALLPDSFKNGMNALSKFEYAQHIPYFLQVFIEVFGGFYCPTDERELLQISEATGIPSEKIPEALELLDEFFPIPNGWVHKGNGVNFVKGVPAYLRGAGCFARQDLYGEDWKSEFPQINWQIPNWHNALYKLLEPTLKVDNEIG